VTGAGEAALPFGRLQRAAGSGYAPLLLAAAAALSAQAAAHETGSAAPMLLAAIIALAAFFVTWRRQERLRLVPLLGLALAFQLAWIVLDLGLGTTSFDSVELYRGWGNEFIHGHYPDAQYPPGAVLLFALDAWIGGGATRTSHAFVMVPFQLLTVAAVWSFRTWAAPWFAALVALWPLNAFFWEFRFDLVPTALLAVGLVLAYRERWLLAGAALGVGAAVKWTPALAFAVLALSLLASLSWRPLARHAGAFLIAFGLLHIPFLLWDSDAVLFSYRYFSSQGITGESVWYLLLAPLGLASVQAREFWLPADVGHWANSLAVMVQAVGLTALAVAVLRVRSSLRAAIGIAAMAPALFLLMNRVFSPQYLVLLLAVWAIAGALLVETRRSQLAVGVAAITAATANAFVYPYTLHQFGVWRLASAALFGIGLMLTVALVALALRVAHAEQEH
jgi:hypothetical protein